MLSNVFRDGEPVSGGAGIELSMPSGSTVDVIVHCSETKPCTENEDPTRGRDLVSFNAFGPWPAANLSWPDSESEP